MLRLFLCKNGHLEVLDQPDRVPPPHEGARLWIAATAPTPEECKLLREGLGLHELALEDSMRRGMPPKLDDYGEHLFVIAHSGVLDAEGRTRKLAIFLARHWIVSVVREPLPLLEDVEARVRREPAVYFGAPDHLAYTLLERLMDGFEGLVDGIIDRVEELEDQALADPRPAVISRILELRSEHAGMLRTVRGQRDVCSQLARTPHAALSKKVQPYLRSMADHTMRLYELLDDVRDNISAARDAYLAVVNNRLSDIMRVLTVIATLVMPLTFVTGVFGMNFEQIPGLKSPLGFWLTMGCMAILCLSMLAFFRRRGWI